ncbi:iron-containing redox enzyme family protein [Paracidovorax anthurii]|uniref:Heme oxygenase-like protein n=1 Tax=Paracidovorax anthurii TaxID=78229 RepID=A0A328Z5Q8_9BURK|nr:iron-containing redox enzyme family protein [Paracidovorax anthurii]RAR81358.1 heme oxygenase-like protein [Paracidovorax anthurii]
MPEFREWYRLASHCEAFLEEHEIIRVMQAVAPPAPGSGSVEVATLQAWRLERTQAWNDAWATLTPPSARERFVQALLLQSAPLGLILGAWLQGMSAPGVCEDPGQLALLSLLADDLGVGRPHGARRDAFRSLLEVGHQPLHGGSAGALLQCHGIDDAMFAWPASLLAMSRRSDVFHAELCAVDWVLRNVGMLPAWSPLRAHWPHRIDWERLDLACSGDGRVVADPLACSDRVAVAIQASSDTAARSFQRGAHWTLQALQAWDAALLAWSVASADIHQSMARLVQCKSREAAVYHQTRPLGGCPLSQRFQQAQANPFPLVEDLAQSRFVRPGQPARSPLVTGLVSPRGPMFGIFPQHELDLLREWVSNLPAAAISGTADSPLVRSTQRGPAPPCPVGPDRPPQALRLHLREAYFLLQGRAMEPALREWAVACVRERLHQATRSPRPGERDLPAAWQPGTLRPWLLDQHDLHGRAYEQSSSKAVTVTREDVIESTLQLAPLILIDGAWLQGFTDTALACSETGAPLFATYWDELGNGQVALNHPRIYRDLLASMDVRLAPTGSWEFATDPRLAEASFELPVYWLCLGKLPAMFLPEILGMNLAMELSGVGDGYRDARRFLAAHGFSTQFVDLHNTIDNVATGHSAWAAEAIEHHMRNAMHTGDSAWIAAQWQRVRAGYASLAKMPESRSQRLLRGLGSLWGRSRPPMQPTRPHHHPAPSLENA